MPRIRPVSDNAPERVKAVPSRNPGSISMAPPAGPRPLIRGSLAAQMSSVLIESGSSGRTVAANDPTWSMASTAKCPEVVAAFWRRADRSDEVWSMSPFG